MKNDTLTNNQFVTDTMAVILRLEKRKMGQNAKSLPLARGLADHIKEW